MKMRHHIPLMVLASATLLFSHPALALFSQQGPKLVGTGAVGSAQQGFSVSVSADGNTAIVGGDLDNSSAGGAAWVYTRSGGVWTQQGSKLVGTGAVGIAFQGYSVSLSSDGNTAIVGGPSDSSNAGAAWVYTRSGGVWTQQGSKLVGTGAVGIAYQGFSVSLSSDGNTAIVGGYRDNGSAGAAWVYTRSGGVWTQQGSKLVGTGAVGIAYQGFSVSLSSDGNTAIVGGFSDSSNAGAAWVYTRSGGVWTQQGSKLVGTGAVGIAFQGVSVSLSSDGNTAIVGGYGDNGSVGAAWVYTRSGGVWTQQGSKLVGTGAFGAAQQGLSVSLSWDGNTAIVGGYGDNGSAGAAWVYTRSGGVWTQQGSKLVGTGAAGAARQGYSVSLSGDGNTAIVGGDFDNGAAGAAWVFAAAAPTAAADLTIIKSHTGNFRQGDTGDTYTITVSNPGLGATSGTVTVTDALPAGLTATAISGTGWTCALSPLGCSRSDILAASASYPVITLTVNVAANAPASATNTATVGGGGEVNTANDTATDPTTIVQLPDLTIGKIHTGNFTQGQTGTTYSITVSNDGTGPTTATVTVTDTLPVGLTATAISGTGWTCNMAPLGCNRSDVLASGASYPAITLTVNVANNAAASLVNTASVSGGGEINAANDAANDPTTVNTVNAVNAAPIPAASEWALMALAGMLALLGVMRIRA